MKAQVCVYIPVSLTTPVITGDQLWLGHSLSFVMSVHSDMLVHFAVPELCVLLHPLPQLISGNTRWCWGIWGAVASDLEVLSSLWKRGGGGWRIETSFFMMLPRSDLPSDKLLAVWFSLTHVSAHLFLLLWGKGKSVMEHLLKLLPLLALQICSDSDL